MTELESHSSLTIEDLDHPRLILIYSIYWDVTLFFTTVFFILMLYTIIKKSSPEMGGYKWYLVHQLCWSYAFDFYMSLWKPIPLWPFYIGYSGGILNQLHVDPPIWFLVILFFLSVWMGLGIGIALVHRYVQGKVYANLLHLLLTTSTLHSLELTMNNIKNCSDRFWTKAFWNGYAGKILKFENSKIPKFQNSKVLFSWTFQFSTPIKSFVLKNYPRLGLSETEECE